MDDTVLVGDRTDFVLVPGSVDSYAVREITADDVGPCEIELDTGIFHVTAVDEGGVCTCCGKDRGLNEPVFGVFEIEVKSDGKTAVEETGVETEVGLL